MINLSQENEVLASRLAAAQRVSVDEAIRRALEAQVRAVGDLQEPKRRDRSPAAIAKRKAGIERAIADFAAMPILDSRSPNEIMDDINAL
jgi:antitoxin VapB